MCSRLKGQSLSGVSGQVQQEAVMYSILNLETNRLVEDYRGLILRFLTPLEACKYADSLRKWDDRYKLLGVVAIDGEALKRYRDLDKEGQKTGDLPSRQVPMPILPRRFEQRSRRGKDIGSRNLPVRGRRSLRKESDPLLCRMQWRPK